jgi:hypothetical protein
MPSIFPIAYFGPISYYKKIANSEELVFEQFDTFPRRAIGKSCVILSPNGTLDLTVPVKKTKGSNSRTNEIEIDYSIDWQKKHWRSIVSAYSSSPFFDYYGMEIEELIFFETKSLIEYTQNIHQRICVWLDLNANFSLSDEYYAELENDYRSSFFYRNNNEVEFYQQVFNDRATFEADLSILDAILNLGPMARKLLI